MRDLKDTRRIVAFGEMMIRLSPSGREMLFQSPRLETYVAGAEVNVLVALAGLGWKAEMISAVPDNPLGDAAIRHLRAHGIQADSVLRGNGRMGLCWVEPGAGLRSTRVLYDRAHSLFAGTPVDAWPWSASIAGAELLHLSGITPALGPLSSAATLAAATVAVDGDVKISFDCNYRAQLWDCWDSRPRETLRALIGQAGILFGNHRDIALVLDRTFCENPQRRRREAAEAAFVAFPKLELIASTERYTENVDHHQMRGRIDRRDDMFETDKIELPGIVDRIGTGDAFAAGVLHAYLDRGTGEDMAKTGLALAAFKHSIPGDAAYLRGGELERFMAGGFDVRR